MSSPKYIVGAGLSRGLSTSCLKIEEICALSGHVQPRGLVDAKTGEIVDLPFLMQFVIRHGTSVSFDKTTTYSPTSSSLPQSSKNSSLVLTSFSHLRLLRRKLLLGFVILVILMAEFNGSGFTLSGVAKIGAPAEANSFGGFSLSIVLEELTALLAPIAVFCGHPGLLLGSG